LIGLRSSMVPEPGPHLGIGRDATQAHRASIKEVQLGRKSSRGASWVSEANHPLLVRANSIRRSAELRCLARGEEVQRQEKCIGQEYFGLPKPITPLKPADRRGGCTTSSLLERGGIDVVERCRWGRASALLLGRPTAHRTRKRAGEPLSSPARVLIAELRSGARRVSLGVDELHRGARA
jgi:hypothetical protein